MPFLFVISILIVLVLFIFTSIIVTVVTIYCYAAGFFLIDVTDALFLISVTFNVSFLMLLPPFVSVSTFIVKTLSIFTITITIINVTYFAHIQHMNCDHHSSRLHLEQCQHKKCHC